jgi:hypothetical protein
VECVLIDTTMNHIHLDECPCQFDRGSRVLKLTAKRFAGRSDSGEVKALGEDRSISGQ